MTKIIIWASGRAGSQRSDLELGRDESWLLTKSEHAAAHRRKVKEEIRKEYERRGMRATRVDIV